MKRFTVIFVLAVFALPLAASPAGAHWRDTWYWSVGRAEYQLGKSTRIAAIFGGDYIDNVDCIPVGISIWSDGYPRVKLYKHFDCEFDVVFSDDYTSQSYDRILHVTGPHSFVMSTP